MHIYINLLAISLLLGCSSSDTDVDMPSEMEEEEIIADKKDQAKITGVTVTGDPGAYTFNVEITSPDTGCDQYADWWEVIDADGNLIHRRVLGHSHVNEQPFVRSGRPVAITADEFVYVRGHMNTNGYGTVVYSGRINEGLKQTLLDDDFSIGLESMSPLPSTCAF